MSRSRSFAVVGLVVVATGLLGSCAVQSAPSIAASFNEILDGDHGLTAADGVLPGRVTVFDERYPAIGNLDPALLSALHAGATAAATEDVTIYVNSGWRSRAYQDELLNEAVAEYGSRAAAARWVATADTSPHVSGEAVDVGHAEAEQWLSKNGAQYGLCQIYRNEPWHYELRPHAIGGRCPRMYTDPSRDPRMEE
jgi:hypothetical protein